MRIAVAVMLYVWGLSGPVFAITLDQVAAGSLLLDAETPGERIAAPVVATDVKIAVTGPIARTVITQRFRNPSDGWVEGVYAFPLPPDAAVDTLRMRVGDRFIEGRIEERVEAQRIYEDARADGRRAALVEQHRPNLFTTSVANIGPGEIVVAQIEFQEALTPKDGAFSLRLPLVAAPRYGLPPIVQAVVYGAGGPSVPPAPETPVADPRSEPVGATRNPVTMTIDLAPGFPLGMLESRFHAMQIERRDDGATLTLAGPVPADRDFELVWTPEAAGAPEASLYSEERAGERHVILTVAPPGAASEAPAPPRDVILVQDVSGSMAGESIRQAREALETALRRLRPEDRFTIIAFNDDYRMWSEAPVPATPEEVARAVRSIRGLDAEGGTNMLPALDRALRLPSDDGRLRQIVFLTDGVVSFEAEMLQLIAEKLGAARLFMVGIGSAPNGYFMTRAAEKGRGAHVYIGDLAEVQAKMEALFAKLETPALTGLSLDLPPGVEAHPAVLPDLYVGEPLAIALRGPATGEARLTGRRGEDRFKMTLDLSAAPARSGVARLFARRRISALEAERLIGGDAGRADAAILETALGYGLVSRLTSLVAVDETSARLFEARLTRAEIARNLPAGWDPAAFVFEQAAPPAPGAAPAIPGLRKASAPFAIEAEDAGAFVPRGALGWRLMVMIGLALGLAGIGVLTLSRGRTA